MTDFTLTDALEMASRLRVPVFERGTMPRTKIEALEEYMLVAAYHLGELGRERLDWHVQLAEDEERWESLEGWEPMRMGRTNRSIDEAKAMLAPELWQTVRHARWRIARLTDEIERLDRDHDKVSRAYTLISGS